MTGLVGFVNLASIDQSGRSVPKGGDQLSREIAKRDNLWLSVICAALFITLLIGLRNWICPDEPSKTTENNWQEELGRMVEIGEQEEVIV